MQTNNLPTWFQRKSWFFRRKKSFFRISPCFILTKGIDPFYIWHTLRIFSGVIAKVAQLVEQLICNQPVVGSSPIFGFKG